MTVEYYSPGDTVVLREIWDGKIWTARPVIVVQDNAELIALHIPRGTRWKMHRGTQGDKVTATERKNREWTLEDAVWDSIYSYIKLAIPGEPYSVLVFRNKEDNSFRNWYINLENPEDPMQRTALGFDYTDQILDLIIEPNLKDWHWEDEDELQEAVELGLISSAKAAILYSKGGEVRDLIMSGNSIFNGWENWHSDSSWEIPVLPENWDEL
jgi:uncharacterized protein